MHRSRALLPVLASLLASAVVLVPSPPLRAQPTAEPSQAGNGRFDPTRLEHIDAVIAEGIAAGQATGVVVAVGDRRGVVFQRAYGQRAIQPAVEAMTLDTIFDVASLTKVVATTPALMLLLESGRIRLADPIVKYLPELGKYGKEAITVRHLLTHTSGLRPDFDLSVDFRGVDEALRLAGEEVPVRAPGEAFSYSDINFILLGELVRRVSGEPLDRFTSGRVFGPLRMTETRFLPPASLRPRIAPTQWCPPSGWPCDGPDRIMLRGVVHDPTARRMGGVAGHAGLFTTAADLSRFARFLLNRGTLDNARVLAPMTVALMTSPATPPGEADVRGLGWDINSRFSTNRGDLMSSASFGHTGFTGTSIWIDPIADLFVVFLSSRLHPDGQGDVTALRGRVATIAAAALLEPRDIGTPPRPSGTSPPPPAARLRTGPTPVLNGIDVLREEGFARLQGRHVGLLTNQTGRALDGTSTVDALRRAPGMTMVALFTPEHGLRGEADTAIASSRDEQSGLPVYSLYGQTRRPTPDMLEGIDTIVVDLQDVGARFYTYITTVAYVMEAAAAHDIEVVVLDRPNPIDGWHIEGPDLDSDAAGFTGYFSMPVRHGMTMGELARLFNGEKHIGARLVVVPMKNWRRELWFDMTGQTWINPSPNLRNLSQATLYPGIGAIEWTNISVGRGTDSPFQQVGAPWIDGVRLARALNARHLPGVAFYPVKFTPSSSLYAGQACYGVFLLTTARQQVRPVRLGLEMFAAIQRLHPDRFEAGETAKLFGSREDLRRVAAGEDPASVAAGWGAQEGKWRLTRAPYLLYR